MKSLIDFMGPFCPFPPFWFMAIGSNTNTEWAVCVDLFCCNALALIYLGGIVHNFTGKMFDKLLVLIAKY